MSSPGYLSSVATIFDNNSHYVDPSEQRQILLSTNSTSFSALEVVDPSTTSQTMLTALTPRSTITRLFPFLPYEVSYGNHLPSFPQRTMATTDSDARRATMLTLADLYDCRIGCPSNPSSGQPALSGLSKDNSRQQLCQHLQLPKIPHLSELEHFTYTRSSRNTAPTTLSFLPSWTRPTLGLTTNLLQVRMTWASKPFTTREQAEANTNTNATGSYGNHYTTSLSDIRNHSIPYAIFCQVIDYDSIFAITPGGTDYQAEWTTASLSMTSPTYTGVAFQPHFSYGSAAPNTFGSALYGYLTSQSTAHPHLDTSTAIFSSQRALSEKPLRNDNESCNSSDYAHRLASHSAIDYCCLTTSLHHALHSSRLVGQSTTHLYYQTSWSGLYSRSDADGHSVTTSRSTMCQPGDSSIEDIGTTDTSPARQSNRTCWSNYSADHTFTTRIQVF